MPKDMIECSSKSVYFKGGVIMRPEIEQKWKEYKKQVCKEWRKKNKEHVNEYIREWRKKNKEKKLQYEINYWTRKAKEWGLDDWKQARNKYYRERKKATAK